MKYSEMPAEQREQHDNLMAIWRERNPKPRRQNNPIALDPKIAERLREISPRMWERYRADWEVKRGKFIGGRDA